MDAHDPLLYKRVCFNIDYHSDIQPSSPLLLISTTRTVPLVPTVQFQLIQRTRILPQSMVPLKVLIEEDQQVSSRRWWCASTVSKTYAYSCFPGQQVHLMVTNTSGSTHSIAEGIIIAVW